MPWLALRWWLCHQGNRSNPLRQRIMAKARKLSKMLRPHLACVPTQGMHEKQHHLTASPPKGRKVVWIENIEMEPCCCYPMSPWTGHERREWLWHSESSQLQCLLGCYLWVDVRECASDHEHFARNLSFGLLVATPGFHYVMHYEGSATQTSDSDLQLLVPRDDVTTGCCFGRWTDQTCLEDPTTSKCPAARSDVQFQMAMGTTTCRFSAARTG